MRDRIGRTEIALGVVAVAALAVFADLAWGIVYGVSIRARDLDVAFDVSHIRIPAADVFFRWLTHLGDTWVVTGMVIVAFVVLWLLHRRSAALFVALTVASGALLNSGLKTLVDRTRPPAMLAVAPIPDSASFPSGHTSATVMFFGALLVVAFVEWGPGLETALFAGGAVALSILVGASRLYLGVHWFTDVIGGLCFGIAWLVLCTIVWLEVRRRFPAGRGPAAEAAEAQSTSAKTSR